MIFGLTSLTNNANSVLEMIRNTFPKLVVQGIDPIYVAGLKHLELIVKQSWTALKRDILYADKAEFDIMARLACDSQISRALDRIGLKSNTTEIAVIAMGDKASVERLSSEFHKYGEMDDKPINFTPEKLNFLLKFHKISKELLGASVLKNELFAYTLAEKAALLHTK